ncbi:hypothetical protein ABH935_002134 [Catenulispora sp. GAS73]|uniref:hypothetical protein n=1 Tax=Catenulispora sp. GAS73 TaxID=3156269 RepID=UPI0035161736
MAGVGEQLKTASAGPRSCANAISRTAIHGKSRWMSASGAPDRQEAAARAISRRSGVPPENVYTPRIQPLTENVRIKAAHVTESGAR